MLNLNDIRDSLTKKGYTQSGVQFVSTDGLVEILDRAIVAEKALSLLCKRIGEVEPCMHCEIADCGGECAHRHHDWAMEKAREQG